MKPWSLYAGLLPAVLGLAACASASKGAPRSSDADARASWGLDATAAETTSDGAAPAPAQPGAQLGSAGEEGVRAKRSEPQPRAGLGTEWGETRTSRISSSPFSRADARHPFATAALFYNDQEGARAMAASTGFRRTSQGGVDVGGVVTARLKGEDGRFLTGFEASNKDFVVGMAGDRYSIVLQSHAPARLEVVVSVDGLDVIDGRAASFTKRGYLLDPHGSIEIDGFRQSMETVAAFRFGAVEDSYAEKKTGESRNVGVIGVAVFHEQGDSPASWRLGDVDRRLQANPFPGQFATPP